MLRLILVLALVLVACGGGVSVHTDYDPLASPRMEKFKTWGWLAPPGGKDTRPDTAVAGEVIPVIERSLAALGYQQESSSPEFKVGWHVARDGTLDVTTVNAYYGYAWGRWFPGGGVAYSRGFRTEFEAGSLVVDIVDSHVNELIWRGVAQDVFHGKEKPEHRAKVLNEAVSRLFTQFPPSRTKR
jgi:Domain of unknown function (DUF4136)